MNVQSQTMTGGSIDRRWDDLQYRIVFALSLPVFFIGAVAMRLLPMLSHEAQTRSVFAQAWEAAGTTAQIAFSG